MKFISKIKNHIELKLLVSTFMVSAAVVLLFAFFMFKANTNDYVKTRAESLIHTSVNIAEDIDSLLSYEHAFFTYVEDRLSVGAGFLTEEDTIILQHLHTSFCDQEIIERQNETSQQESTDFSVYSSVDKYVPFRKSIHENWNIPIGQFTLTANGDTTTIRRSLAVDSINKRIEKSIDHLNGNDSGIYGELVYLQNGEVSIASLAGDDQKLFYLDSISEQNRIISVYRNSEGLITILPLRNSEKWCVVSTLPFSAFRPEIISRVISFLLLSIGMVLLMTVFIGVGIRNSVLNRIVTLQKILNQEWVDTAAFNELRSGDEIGGLVIAFQKMSRQIQRRVEMERLIAGVSRELADADNEQFNNILHDILKQIGVFSQSDHCYLLFYEEGTGKVNKACEWTRNGVASSVKTFGDWGNSDLPWLREQMSQDKPVVLDSLTQFPDEARSEQEFWSGGGKGAVVKTLVMHPIKIKGVLIGAIGCETLVSTFAWTSFDTQLLGMVAEIIGNSVDRQKTAEVMEEQNQQLFQAQKMETVGHLAGGIAHDFNNILAGIISSTSLFRSEYDSSNSISYEEIELFLDTVEHAGNRAKGVVQQLLGLSRKQEYTFSTFDLNDSIRQAYEIGKSSFDKSVKIELDLCDGKAYAEIDPVQIEQVILNFMVNGVHAMTVMRPNDESWGGELLVTSNLQKVDNEFRGEHPIAFENRYWQISITDSGVGIHEDFYDKVFDPFFTTKEKGLGTGLGLSMIYRIVQEHYGFVEFESKLGVGTTFHIFIPVSEHGEVEVVEHIPDVVKDVSSARVLVVDDEPLLRKIAQKILVNIGHEVIVAEDGGEAVDIYANEWESIDIILLDLVMPVLSGRETYIALKKINPNVRVIVSSGFRKDERVDEMIELGARDFLQKPYTVDQLSDLIKKLLAEIQS